MKVVVTGVTGAVGPFVVSELEKGHELALFARRPVESRHRLVLGDMLSLEDCRRALEGAEAVVHLGARSEPSQDAFQVNLVSTYHMMEAAREHRVARVIFASTNCVYGHCFRVSDRAFPVAFLPIDETHPRIPEDNYGLSKLLNEEMLATFTRTWGLRTAALRLNWVWGPKEIQWRADMPELNLAQFAPYFWAYVDARDTARAFRLALEARDLPEHGVYNITAADTMADENSMDLIARFYPGMQVRSDLSGRASLFDWRCAQQAFGYEPQCSWKDGWTGLD
jgi:nucleoside-diphosphate-sugar epimerase